MPQRIIVTGAAGYLGSVLVGRLLAHDYAVLALDALHFGGAALVPFVGDERFAFRNIDLAGDTLTTDTLAALLDGADAVVHFAALVGFPACDAAGRERTWRTNVGATELVYEAAARAGVGRMVFASSYSNYGAALDGQPVTESSALHPQSLYAESKIAAEQSLRARAGAGGPAPVCLRLATVFGVSPRTRFDLMVNQFVLEALTTGHLILYQQDYNRSFVHVRDVAAAIERVIEVDVARVDGQIFNIGSERLNTTKVELADMIRHYRSDVRVAFSDAHFSGDMRSLHVSFEKARRVLGYEARIGLERGIAELCAAIESGLIAEPHSPRYRNHAPLLT